MFQQLLNRFGSRGSHRSVWLPTPFVLSETKVCGVDMRLVTHERDQVMGGWVRGTRVWSKQDLAEYRLLMEHARGARLIIDVGANIGVVSVLLSRAAPDALIYALEPDPLNFAMAQLNLELNNCSRVRVMNAAVADFTGILNLYRSRDNWGDHQTYQTRSNGAGASPVRERESCSVLAVDPATIFAGGVETRDKPQIDLLKIDTQGSDIKILKAFQPFLGAGSTVSIEFSPHHLQMSGTQEDDVYRCLRSTRCIRMIVAPASPKAPWATKETGADELVSYFREGTKGYEVVGYRDLILDF
jgi:FkbM family methyltransferase